MTDHTPDAGPDRRGFLQAAGLAGAAVALADAQDPPGLPPFSNLGPDKIPHKQFGKTKETVSVIGIGGHTLGKAPTLKDAVDIVPVVEASVLFG